MGSAVAGVVGAAGMEGPPKPEMPAHTLPILDDAGAKINIGTDEGFDPREDGGGFVDTNLTRLSGRSLGGLGRSGLAL